LRIRSLAGCTTDTHESRFRKRQGEHHSLGRTYRRRPNRITRRPQATALTDVTQWQGAKVGSHLEGLDRDLKRHRSLIPMKLSLLIGAEHRPADSMAQRLTEHLEQVRLARELGFDGVSIGNHLSYGATAWFPPFETRMRLSAEPRPCRSVLQFCCAATKFCSAQTARFSAAAQGLGGDATSFAD
jgi:hypothetical protein